MTDPVQQKASFMFSTLNPNQTPEIKKTPTNERCVSFEAFKESLGAAANDYSDKEIDQIRIIFDEIADRVFNEWIRKMNSDMISSKENLIP